MSEYEFLGAERARARREQSGATDPSPIARLQSSMGNAGIARLLQREGAEEEELQMKRDPALAQREEAEEEEIAMKRDPALAQRQEDEEEEIAMKRDPALAQREAEVGLAGGAVSDGLANRIDSARGTGSPLDDGTKSTMEDALGTSLDGVRVHTGSESDALNRSITAKAFTTGNDVFVRSDQYSPGSSDTQRLMAHELTHVAQQRSGVGGGESGMTVGAADTVEEREADQVADTVAQRALQRHGDTDEQQ